MKYKSRNHLLYCKMTVVYNVSNGVDIKGSIISFHGGCFTGGNTTWDYGQNIVLSELGYTVYQVSFPKTNEKFLEWLEKYDFSNHEQPIYCLGRSSGGYLAKLFSQKHADKIKKTLYICPVFNPLLRCELRPKFHTQTMLFFENQKPISTEKWDNDKECLLLALQDENVPDECFTEEQLKNALHLGASTHCGMLKCTSIKFLDVVIDFFRDE